MRMIPYTPTDQERLEYAATHIPFRVWSKHCCDGKAKDWPHKRDYGLPPDIPSVHLDFFFINTDLDEEVLTVLGLNERGQAKQSEGQRCRTSPHRSSLWQQLAATWISGGTTTPP